MSGIGLGQNQICQYNKTQEVMSYSKKRLKQMKYEHKKYIQLPQYENNLAHSLMNRFRLPFQIELFNKEMNDRSIEYMSKCLVQSDNRQSVDLDMAKKWHIEDSQLSDQGVMNLSMGIKLVENLDKLHLGLNGWGYWNNQITNKSLSYLNCAIQDQCQLQEFRVDLNMWAYENNKITDSGAKQLLEGIGQLRQLGKLEINMKGWGECNENITDSTISSLNNCLKLLDNLTEIKLILWENVSIQAVKSLNKTLAQMDNLNRIELKFESCSAIQRNPENNHNLNNKLDSIKKTALQKRRLLFQTNTLMTKLSSILSKHKIWNIGLKL